MFEKSIPRMPASSKRRSYGTKKRKVEYVDDFAPSTPPKVSESRELQNLMMSILLESTLDDANTSNSSITLSSSGAKRVASKQRKFLTKVMKIAGTTAGVAVIATVLGNNPSVRSAFKSLLGYTSSLVPESTRKWFLTTMETLRDKIPALRPWLPEKPTPIPPAAPAMPSFKNKAWKWVRNTTSSALSAGGELARGATWAAFRGSVAGGAMLISAATKTSLKSLIWLLKHPETWYWSYYRYIFIYGKVLFFKAFGGGKQWYYIDIDQLGKMKFTT